MTININLNDFGLNNGICETIVTTFNKLEFNAAPIGIIRKDDTTFIRIFKNSQTYGNILEEKLLVVNIVDDPILFVLSAFSKISIDEFDVTEYKNNAIPVLKKACAWILFRCLKIRITDIALVATIEPIDSKINILKITAANRGFNAVLEATIHATRYLVTKEKKYVDLIEMYENLTNKCGGEREKKAFDLLKTFI